MEDGSEADDNLLSLTKFEKEGSESHIYSNLKGLHNFLIKGSVYSIIGQRFDLVQGRQ